MLALARKRKESIVIGDIRITVVEIRGQVGPSWHRSAEKVLVYRREVYDNLHADGPGLGGIDGPLA